MKSKLSVLAGIMALLLLVGCASSPTSDQGTVNPQNEKTADSNGAAQDAVDELAGNGETDLKYVGMCFPQFNAPWYVQISDEITSVLEEQGIQVETASCDNNFARQLEIIENYSQKGVDGLVLFPVGASEIGSTLEAMQEQGVRVVVIMNKVDKGYDALLLTDYAEQGRMCAQMAAKWIDETFPDAEPGSIEVGALTVRMSEEADAMSSGMLSIAEYTDKAKVVTEYETAFSDPEIKSRESIENMLLSHPNIKCLLTYAPSTAVDETIMNNPAIDPATFGIFTNTKVDVILERIAASRNNESVLRGLIASGDGHYYHVGRAMLGEVELNEENIAYDELITITAENVDQFLE